MAWTDPPSYTNGQIITQTDLHVGLRDNMRELWHKIAEVPFTSSVNLTGTTEGSPTTIVSAGAITYAAYPTIVEFYCPLYDNASQATNGINLWDTTSTDLGRIVAQAASVALRAPVHVWTEAFTPTAASHTYMIRGWGGAATGVVTAGAGGTGVTKQGYIRVWQKGGS